LLIAFNVCHSLASGTERLRHRCGHNRATSHLGYGLSEIIRYLWPVAPMKAISANDDVLGISMMLNPNTAKLVIISAVA